MENNKKNQVSAGSASSTHVSSSSSSSSSLSSSSRSLDHLFGPKDSSSSSTSLFGSIFPPVPPPGVGRERWQEYGYQVGGKNGSKGENMNGITSKDSMAYHQNEGGEPCNFSSSIYYGGQENYSPRSGTTESHHYGHISKRDGSEDDANGNNSNSASRGNWWKGSLYY